MFIQRIGNNQLFSVNWFGNFIIPYGAGCYDKFRAIKRFVMPHKISSILGVWSFAHDYHIHNLGGIFYE